MHPLVVEQRRFTRRRGVSGVNLRLLSADAEPLRETFIECESSLTLSVYRLGHVRPRGLTAWVGH